MNKISNIFKTIDKRWRNLPRIVPVLVIMVSTFLSIHYSFIWLFVVLIVAFGAMLFLPENGVSSSKLQEQLPKPKDVDKQS